MDKALELCRKMLDWFANIGQESELKKIREMYLSRDVQGLVSKVKQCRRTNREIVIFSIGCIGPDAEAAEPILIELLENFQRRYNYHDDWRNSTIKVFSPSPPPAKDIYEFDVYKATRLALRKIKLKKTSRDVDLLEDDDGIDFEERILCPDGTCLGIIVGGKCSECGKRP